jgi:UDP-N-acetylmuramoyl-tripeptide--D-alanyl-D-alanine ligase
MLRTALSALGRTHAAVASYNNHWGLPLTLARTPRDAEYCVAEIGMNHAGEIAPLARLARPHVAVITAVEKAHIGFLGSIEAIADEKAAILRGLEPGGVAVLPADTPLLPRLRAAAGDASVVTFGMAASADVRLVGLSMAAEASDIIAEVSGERFRFRLAAPGRHMALNALAALAAVMHAADASPERLVPALEGFSPVAGRGARRQIAVPGGTALLLDESYNGNPASMRAALAVLRLQPARRRVAVLGDMLELGEAGPAEHRALAAYASAAADCLFACGPLMAGLYDALPPPIRAGYAADSAALAPLVARAIAPGDAVLVKGSLGSRMKQIVDTLEPHAKAA